jgi:hypothetical protein
LQVFLSVLALNRHCEPTGRRNAPPDDRLREAIHRATKKNGLLRRFAPRNDERTMNSLFSPVSADSVSLCDALAVAA